ncbi:MAG TPA: acyltransferase [Thermoleophilaceae bacterium]|jgi:lipopolysaccharide O-acetyltransferase
MRWFATATRPYWRRRFAEFGSESLLYRPAWVHRPELMAIGSRVWISQDAWFEVGGEPGGPPRIRLGEGVVLRHHVTLSAFESVTIEPEVLIAAYTSIYDSDHTIGRDRNAIWYPHRVEPVRIGFGSWLGERVQVLKGADVGRHCIIGANSVVRGTIPDYSVAVGAPARVVGDTREMVERSEP